MFLMQFINDLCLEPFILLMNYHIKLLRGTLKLYVCSTNHPLTYINDNTDDIITLSQVEILDDKLSITIAPARLIDFTDTVLPNKGILYEVMLDLLVKYTVSEGH